MRILWNKGYDVLINITDICDARCVMCNIWKNQVRHDSFLPAELLQSLHPVASVSLAGGEPFLHKGVVDLVRVIHQHNPRAKIVFTSNGFRTDAIVEKAREIAKIHPHVQVTISLDGIGAVHDRVRGIPGAWDKVNRTFDLLGEAGIRKRNFAFTITSENMAALPEVYRHAKSKGAGISIALAQSSVFLNVKIPLLDPEKLYPYLTPVIEDHLRSWSPMNWARAFFFYGQLRFLETGLRPIACDAMDKSFVIEQTGRVMSCHPLYLEAGRLKEQTLPEILQGPKAQDLKVKLRNCHACWEVCTARSGLRTNIARVLLWALWSKLLSHARRWNPRRPSRLFPLTAGKKECAS